MFPTPVLAKELEYFVYEWIIDLIGDNDSAQYGTIHGSPTPRMLLWT